ncbi:GntR family transcriptional regulator [Nonomuraea sp. SMC257]|uniref:GntR family transcriptional regulator n=1 Tax=Nonomuraea montanisoli TaxID=2741721 RepID=A0A7Y6I3G7_9ACTN|nr:GntR family transcriptional regulator [Nonomuraea montanisoli]NUW29829.1 GntR family transcriptional regulator [Nonomuraea montanisoli]
MENSGGAGSPPRPKYRILQDELSDRIRRGVYRPGQALPAQRKLAASLGVTLMTLRQALRALSDQGLVVQEPGRGTFVTSPVAAYRLETLRSLADDLRAQGRDVATKVLSVEVRRLPSAVAASLGASDDAWGLRLERMRLVDGDPAIHQDSWVPEPYASMIRGEDFEVMPLYHALATLCGAAIASATEAIRPVALPARLAEILRLPAGSPVFSSERVTRSLDGAALVHDQAHIDGSRMLIRADRLARSMSLHWSLHQ